MIRKPFKVLLIFLNLLFAAALLCSYMALYISPEKYWFISFFGLGYPIALMANVFFCFFWIFFKKKWFVLSLILVIGGIGKWDDVYTFGWNKSNKTPNLTVMSYNVRLFDLYNWTKNKESRNKIIDEIYESKPDILCMQEFYYTSNSDFNTLDTLKEITGCSNYFVGHTAHVKGLYHWGIATLSRYPIIRNGIVPFDDKTDNISIFTDVKINNDTIRVYNVHLESIRFRKNEYAFIDSVANKGGKLNNPTTKNIFKKLNKAFSIRARQVDAIVKHSESCTYPKLICGDFNDTPGSYAYHQLSKNRLDAFSEAGLGFGVTYAGLIPLLRIDYILYDNEIGQISNFKTGRKAYSDHYSISAKFHRK